MQLQRSFVVYTFTIRAIWLQYLDFHLLLETQTKVKWKRVMLQITHSSE